MITISVHAKENIEESFSVRLLIEWDNYDRIKINNQDNDNDCVGDHGSIAMHKNPHDQATISYLNGDDADEIFPTSVTSISFTETRTHVQTSQNTQSLFDRFICHTIRILVVQNAATLNGFRPRNRVMKMPGIQIYLRERRKLMIAMRRG
jgi:hypothetical protein